ncbi:glutathione S-transferase family protein [Pseudomonas sp. 5P_3.1_Bac2]|uniref:glutathione S-transferase family protein n=1 Tax=Pseudomonas sp. 5P_3.1_Bac2 TaxID=2971617 RepID=UPI0021C5A845|nr:glutathione S-transferase [Pseudomonas sp. 5P_3.1_Bac2]MCU1719152.1 glutathione S-transferase [Pseudomonas sp. 5P_3.1_Bac2]
MKLYDLDPSGNCYKVRLFAALANIQLEIVPVDFLAGEHKRAPLLDLNPRGELPILLDGKQVLYDAQAILVYLAGAYGGLAWWPAQVQGQAQIVQWLSFAANEVQHSLSAARLVQKFGYALDQAAAVDKSARVLAILDQHLKTHDWLAIGRPSIADCAVYPYVALAHEGGVDITPYSHIGQWINRIETLPGYLPKP